MTSLSEDPWEPRTEEGFSASAPKNDLSISSLSFYWTLAAFAIIGISGIAINQIIVDQFGVAPLGRFNTLLAITLIGGQLGSASIHSSVLYHTPKARSTNHPTGQIIIAGMKVTLITSTLAAAAILLLGEMILRSTGNSYYLDGLRGIAIGLFFYPLNKTLGAHLNGLRKIKAFSMFLAGRFLLLLAAVVATAYSFHSENLLPWAISISELLIFIFLVLSIRSELVKTKREKTLSGLVKLHLQFGLRGILGGVLLDLNTRIDILVLGVLVGSRAVGIYSLASLFAEGLYQLAMTARYNYDPVVTQLHVEGRTHELEHTIKNAKRKVYAPMVGVTLLANLSYPLVAQILFGRDLAYESWPVFAILTIGVMSSAGYIPFTNLPQQIGAPLRQSKLLGAISGTNLVLNVLLIPFWGPIGAAIATAISQVALIPYLRRLTFPLLKFKP